MKKLFFALSVFILINNLYAQQEEILKLYNQAYGLGENQKYQEALTIIEKAIDLTSEVSDTSKLKYKVLDYKGEILVALKKYDKALEWLNQILDKKNKNLPIHHHSFFYTDSLLERLHYSQFHYKNALYHAHQCKANSEQNANNYGFYYSLVRMAENQSNLGYFDSTITSYEQALQILLNHYSNNYRDIAFVYSQLSSLYAEIYYNNKADEMLNLSLSYRKKILSPNQPEYGQIYYDQGFNVLRKKDYKTALIYFNKANDLFLLDSVNYSEKLVLTYRRQGECYYRLKNYDEAIKYYNRAKSKVIQHDKLNIYDINIARIYIQLKEYDNALNQLQLTESYFRSINYNGHFKGRLNFYFGYTHAFINKSYMDSGYLDKAQIHYNLSIDYYKKALEIFTDGDKFNTWISSTNMEIGYIQMRYDTISSLDYMQKAVMASLSGFEPENYFEIPNTDRIAPNSWTVITLKHKSTALYINYLKTKNIKFLIAAYKHSKAVIELFERHKTFINSETDILQLMNNQLQAYNDALERVQLLYELTGDEKYINDLFSLSEQRKYSTLRSSLLHVSAKEYANLPDSLIDRENEIDRMIMVYQNQLNTEKSKTQPKTDRIELFENKLNQYHIDKINHHNFLEKNYPEYYSLKTNNRVPHIKEIQQLLKPNELLVEYSLTDTSLFRLAIGKNNVDVYHAPVSDLVNNMVDSLIATSQLDLNKLSATNLLSDFSKNAHLVYNLLFNGITDKIAGKDLLIVPEGKLNYLPFEMLVTQQVNQPTNFRDLPYLLKSNPVSYSHSVSIKLEADRIHRSGKKQLLAMAPEYSDNMNQQLQLRGYPALENLPWASEEVSNISRLIGGVSFTGKQATETHFKQQAPNYRILHLAAHTLLDFENPMQSKLVFTNTSDSLNDGMLNTYEIYNLDLNADLTVLSACETGLGRFQRGEGLMSLARGFLYSGCPSLVMTLWPVEDKSSAEISKSFYSYLHQGFSKSKALQLSKLDHLNNSDPLTAHPFFWAGYVSVGNQDALFSTRQNKWLFIIALAGLLTALLIWMYRRKIKV